MTKGAPRIEGAWRTTGYIVAGQSHDIDGVLLLVDGWWTTFYFVPGDAGPWVSAESGLYDREADRLTFHHRLVFQGGGGRDLVIDQKATREEPCRIDLSDDALAIHFPSGNTVRCTRLPALADYQPS